MFIKAMRSGPGRGGVEARSRVCTCATMKENTVNIHAARDLMTSFSLVYIHGGQGAHAWGPHLYVSGPFQHAATRRPAASPSPYLCYGPRPDRDPRASHVTRSGAHVLARCLYPAYAQRHPPHASVATRLLEADRPVRPALFQAT